MPLIHAASEVIKPFCTAIRRHNADNTSFYANMIHFDLVFNDLRGTFDTNLEINLEEEEALMKKMTGTVSAKGEKMTLGERVVWEV